MKKLLLLTLLLLTFVVVSGQIETRYFPEGGALNEFEYGFKVDQSNNLVTMPVFDMNDIKPDSLDGIGGAYRFGYAFDYDYSQDDGGWTTVNGGKLWTLSFKSEAAYSLNFIFNEIILPEGVALNICNEAKTTLYGPITSDFNRTGDIFLTDIIPGEQVTMFMFVSDSIQEVPRLNISRVVHGFKQLDKEMRGLGDASNLTVDVNCYPSWSIESDGVARVLRDDGTSYCSGFLLASTNKSFEPYFYTAFHCVDSNKDGILSSSEKKSVQSWTFVFNLKKVSCGGSTITSSLSYSGSTLLASWEPSDFALLKISSTAIKNDTRLSWLGWDRTGNAPSSGTSIHHPKGDVMKISFDSSPLSFNTLPLFTYPINSLWQSEVEIGLLEPGSSGAPFFDQNKRVFGHVTGLWQSSQLPQIVFIGCFFKSWNGGGTSSTRLKDWLDPGNTGRTTMSTMRRWNVSGPNLLCSSSTYQIMNLPEGATVTWSQGPGILRESAQGSNPCNFRKTSNGINSWIRATITCDGLTYTTPQLSVWVGTPATPTIIPSDNVITVMSGYYYQVPQYESNVYFQMGFDPRITSEEWDYYGANSMYDYGDYLEMSTYELGENQVIASQYNACSTEPSNAYFTVEVVDAYNFGYKSAELEVSPNPASDYLDISFVVPEDIQKQKSYRVDFVNSYSRVIKQVLVSGEENRVDIQELPAGYYIVRVIYGDEIFSKNLIVE